MAAAFDRDALAGRLRPDRSRGGKGRNETADCGLWRVRADARKQFSILRRSVDVSQLEQSVTRLAGGRS